MFTNNPFKSDDADFLSDPEELTYLSLIKADSRTVLMQKLLFDSISEFAEVVSSLSNNHTLQFENCVFKQIDDNSKSKSDSNYSDTKKTKDKMVLQNLQFVKCKIENTKMFKKTLIRLRNCRSIAKHYL